MAGRRGPLLDAEPEAGYAPVASGFLDAETAWRHLFETIVGTRRGERDPEALLAWALEDTSADKLSGLSDAVQTGLAEAVGASAGGGARVIFESAVRLGRRAVSVWPRGARALRCRLHGRRTGGKGQG